MWKQFDEGWTWIPGFWTETKLQNLSYIQNRPPETLQEDVGTPPAKNFFWMQGYWAYQDRTDDFDWVKGDWQKLDPKWVLVPSHYTWRSEGYVFIPAYWDWALKERADVYASVHVEPAYREKIVYVPTLVVDHRIWVRGLFLYYPDYMAYIYHDWYFYPHWWNVCGCSPSWWGWGGGFWWGIPWHQQWSLWWWWSHPGFPHPFWMNAHLAMMMQAPGGNLIGWMHGMHAPLFITPLGILPPDQFAEGIKDLTGNALPIVPLKPDIRDDLGKLVNPKITDSLRPGGGEVKLPIAVPDFGNKKPGDSLDQTAPPKPNLGDRVRPPIRPIAPSEETPSVVNPVPMPRTPEVENIRRPRVPQVDWNRNPIKPRYPNYPRPRPKPPTDSNDYPRYPNYPRPKPKPQTDSNDYPRYPNYPRPKPKPNRDVEKYPSRPRPKPNVNWQGNHKKPTLRPNRDYNPPSQTDKPRNQDRNTFK